MSACCALVPVKSNVAERAVLSIRDCNPDMRLIIHFIVELAILEAIEEAPHQLFGIGEDVAHVGGDRLGAVIVRGLH